MVVPKKRSREPAGEEEEEEEEQRQHQQGMDHPSHRDHDDNDDASDDSSDDDEDDEQEEGRPAHASTLDMILQQQQQRGVPKEGDGASSSGASQDEEEDDDDKEEDSQDGPVHRRKTPSTLRQHMDSRATSSSSRGRKEGEDRRIGAGRGVRGPRQPRDKESIQARRQYRCHIPSCDKAFTERRNLAQHLKTGHSDIRPFSCTVVGCDKSFKYKCVLDKHMEGCYKGPAGAHFLLQAPEEGIAREHQQQQPPQEIIGGQQHTQMSLRCRRTTTLSKATLRALQTADRSSKLYRNLLLDAIIGTVG